MIIIAVSLQNATSLLVKAKTPVDLPAFTTGDISCVYQIIVSKVETLSPNDVILIFISRSAILRCEHTHRGIPIHFDLVFWQFRKCRVR